MVKEEEVVVVFYFEFQNVHAITLKRQQQHYLKRCTKKVVEGYSVTWVTF